MKIDLALFTPGEAERITGVSADLQRDWRRRGFIAKQDGHSRFSVFDLAEMLVLKALANRGIGPDRGKEIAETAATEVAIAALRWIDAWSDGARSRQPENMTWGEFADNLISEAMMVQIYSARMMPRLSVAHDAKLIWWSDDSFTLTGSVDNQLAALTSQDPKISGAVVILDLAGLASRMTETAGRPFASVE